VDERGPKAGVYGEDGVATFVDETGPGVGACDAQVVTVTALGRTDTAVAEIEAEDMDVRRRVFQRVVSTFRTPTGSWCEARF
jgi:hypothetical protein